MQTRSLYKIQAVVQSNRWVSASDAQSIAVSGPSLVVCFARRQ